MSTHTAEVVLVELKPHPNADTLSLVECEGWQVVTNTAQWEGKTKGIFIKPDTIVNTDRPEFSFLAPKGKQARIKGIKLRGEFSAGLLLVAPDDAIIGEDFYDRLGLEHYEPELTYSTKGSFAKGPDNWAGLSKYDIENGKSSKIARLFIDDEDVSVTVKLNGSNCSFVFSDGEMHVKSRSGFRSDTDNIFWEALRATPEVEDFCKKYPDFLVVGEAYGNVKGYKYDCTNGVKFRIFDIMRKDRSYLDYTELLLTCNMYGLPRVPDLGVRKFNYKELLELAEQDCPLGNKVPEGIVVRPIKDRRDPRHGRVIAKFVSNRYLTEK